MTAAAEQRLSGAAHIRLRGLPYAAAAARADKYVQWGRMPFFEILLISIDLDHSGQKWENVDSDHVSLKQLTALTNICTSSIMVLVLNQSCYNK